MLSELQNQLKQKQADIELAASVGQSLLEEIDFLKKKLNERHQERQFSTPKSSRRLKNLETLDSSIDNSKDLLETIENLKIENKNLVKKNDKLSRTNDAINENCWNLEVESQNLKEELKNTKALLGKSQQLCNNLQKIEKDLRLEQENLVSVFHTTLSRNKELENQLENLKKKEKDMPMHAFINESVKITRSISVQVQEENSEQVSILKSGKKHMIIDDKILSTFSHLQTENAIMGLENNNLKELNERLESELQNLKEEFNKCQKNLKEEDCQTDLDFGEFLDLSDTAQIVLMENELRNEWQIKRHVGLQVPSILYPEQHYDLLVKKRSRFSVETKNFGSNVEDLEDLEDFNVDKLQSEVSERISRMHDGPGMGENTIDALVYTMIGSWFQKYNRSGKYPKLRYFWVNPYSRTLHWAKTSPSQGNPRSATRVVPIHSVTWNEDIQAHKNYSPAEIDSLDITTTNRIIRLQPLNWADRDLWISGLSVLLKRSSEKSLTQEAASEVIQNKSWQDSQSLNGSITSSIGRKNSSLGHGTTKSLHSSPRKSISHRRSMTIIANEETPKSSRFTFNAL